LTEELCLGGRDPRAEPPVREAKPQGVEVVSPFLAVSPFAFGALCPTKATRAQAQTLHGARMGELTKS